MRWHARVILFMIVALLTRLLRHLAAVSFRGEEAVQVIPKDSFQTIVSSLEPYGIRALSTQSKACITRHYEIDATTLSIDCVIAVAGQLGIYLAAADWDNLKDNLKSMTDTGASGSRVATAAATAVTAVTAVTTQDIVPTSAVQQLAPKPSIQCNQ